ncbi:MAG: tyrosine-type recombinase/integrase [Chthoniobacteraceae bacterium]
MTNSDQIKALMNRKSVQQVSKQKFARTDLRYWQEAIFRPTYKKDGTTCSLQEWVAKIQHCGRREVFNLHTPNKAAAAALAKEIYISLVGAGWQTTLAKHKPEMQRKAVSTVGDFLTELSGHWSGKPKTFEDYCRALRTLLSQIFGVEGGRGKFDYVNGGRDKWVAKINRIKLIKITPDKVNKWRIAFVKKAGGNPLKARRARITCNSLMRQAKSLFAPKLLTHVAIHKPDKLPFDGVAFYERDSMRYHSTVDVEALIKDALTELPVEQLKIFLLAVMVGLRRGEIDNLLWTGFRWDGGVVRIEAATEHFAPKTSDSAGDIPIDEELAALFRGWKAKASGPFVIESKTPPRSNPKYTRYRAQRHFDGLLGWLRSKGVTAIKPLHELRKEFGSQICSKHGIYTASRMLRHADIAITAQHYLDQKERVTIGMGGLLPRPENFTPLTTRANRNLKAIPQESCKS